MSFAKEPFPAVLIVVKDYLGCMATDFI